MFRAIHIHIHIYLTAIGLKPGGSSKATFTLKQYIEYKERNNIAITKREVWSARRAPSVRVIPWHLPYNCAHHQEVKIVLYSTWYHHTCRWPFSAQV